MLREYVSSGVTIWSGHAFTVSLVDSSYGLSHRIFCCVFGVGKLPARGAMEQWKKTFGCWVRIDHDNASLKKTSLIGWYKWTRCSLKKHVFSFICTWNMLKTPPSHWKRPKWSIWVCLKIEELNILLEVVHATRIPLCITLGTRTGFGLQIWYSKRKMKHVTNSFPSLPMSSPHTGWKNRSICT